MKIGFLSQLSGFAKYACQCALTVGLMTPGNAAVAQAFTSDTPEELANAHRAYLAGNNDEAMAHIKTTLEQHRHENAVSANAFELLRQIMKENSVTNPPSTKLPREISSLRFGVTHRNENGRISYVLQLKAKLLTATQITSMRVAYFDGEALLDSATALGKMTLEVDDNPTMVIARYDLSQAPAEGPLAIDIGFDNGAHWQGWAPLLDLQSTASPVVLDLTPGKVFSTGTPVFKWLDFESPEYKRSVESRGFWASVSIDSKPRWIDLVIKDSWVDGLTPSLAVPQDKPLADGPYVFNIKYFEGRKFGDIKIVRGSQSVRNFEVKR